ncbi:MAG: hypothetical protein IT365_04880 [Candidatus Hydrogenedentes bacterium]|nr:hypothetical protein [Candidatus Hydrogenedentota bacterium]
MLSWTKLFCGSFLVLSAVLVAGCNELNDGNMYVRAYSVKECANGGYLVAGIALPDCGGIKTRYIQLVRTDASGAKVWDILLASEELPQGSGASARELSNGDFVVAAGNADNVVVIRTDANGGEVWTTSFVPANDSALHSVFEMSDGGILVASGSLTKLSSDGDFLWDEAFSDQNIIAIDGCEQTVDGGFILTGRTLESSVTVPCLIRLDSSGSMLWLEQVDGESSEERNALRLNDVCEANNGEYVAIGEYWDTQEWLLYDVIVRFDGEGNELWRKTSDGQDTYVNGRFLKDIIACSDGEFAVAGATYSSETTLYDDLFLRIDSQGEQIATSTVGGKGYQALFSIAECDGGALVAAGYTFPGENGLLSSGYPKSLLVKTDSALTMLWEKVFPESYPGCLPCIPLPRY